MSFKIIGKSVENRGNNESCDTIFKGHIKPCFQISRETFNFILNQIRYHLTRDTTAEEPISPQGRLGICLYRLSCGDYYYTNAEMTGRGLTTVQCNAQEVCKVTVSNLLSEFVSFPKNSRPNANRNFYK